MSQPIFRKKHFEVLAAAFRRGGGKLDAYDMADLLEQQNSMFNRKKFLEEATHVQLSGQPEGDTVDVLRDRR